MDVDVLFEVWSICKEYIPAKDRSTAADHVVNELMDLLGDKELAEFCSRDHHLADVHESYSSPDDEVEED